MRPKICKILLVATCWLIGLAMAILGSKVYAAEEGHELTMPDIEKAYRELKATEGETAVKAFLDECGTAAKRGDIEITGGISDEGGYEEYERLRATIAGFAAGIEKGLGSETLKVEVDKLGISLEQAKQLGDAMNPGDWQRADNLFKKLGLQEKFGGSDTIYNKLGQEMGYDQQSYSSASLNDALVEFRREFEAWHLDMLNDEQKRGMEEAITRVRGAQSINK